jgi:fructose-specific phosphotransferase system IIA component
MRIVDILNINSIQIGLKASNKKALLEKMIDLAEYSGKLLNLDDVKKEVYEREKIMSTGIGKGVAIPHAKTNFINNSIAAFAILDSPIEYDSIDGNPVNIICLLLGQESKVGNHLRLLSKVSRLVNTDNIRSDLLAAQNPSEILEIIRRNEDNF